MTRSNCEFNGLELLCAVLLTFPSVNNKKELFEIMNDTDNVNKKIVFNKETDFANYKLDLVKKRNLCDIYITNFRNNFKDIKVDYDKIVKVYLTGKSNNIPIIEELNKGINRKQAKADLYIEIDVRIKTNLNKRFIGLSVKQSKAATKSNYSVEEKLGNINSEYKKILVNTKKQFLEDNGFPEFNKKDRPSVNKLFYRDNNNPYWDKMKELIESCNSELCQLYSNDLFPSLPYNLYEFNGEIFVDLNCKIVKTNLEHCEKFYHYKDDINQKMRETAKLFYKLVIEFDNEITKEFKVEIRWKGKIHGCSPQFQTHEL